MINREKSLLAELDALQRDNEALRRELDQTRQLLDICTAKLPNDVDSDSDIDQMAADLAAARELATESAKAAGSYRMDLAAANKELDRLRDQIGYIFNRYPNIVKRARLEIAASRDDGKDAERYRWLRDKCDTTRGFLLGMRRERDEWDAEIDAAIAQDNEP